jgi:hypothetical protein
MDCTQVVEPLLCKYEALSSNPSPTKQTNKQKTLKFWSITISIMSKDFSSSLPYCSAPLLHEEFSSGEQEKLG